MKKVCFALILIGASFMAKASVVDEWLEKGQIEEATKVIDTEINKKPKEPLTWLGYAKLMLVKNDSEKAWAGLIQARKLLEALNQQPTEKIKAYEAQYYQMEGAWYFQKQLWDKAIYSFKKSIQYDENNLETNIWLISTLFTNHQLKEAANLSSKLKNLYPKDNVIEYLYRISHASEKELQALIKLQPSLMAPEMMLIDLYMQKGEYAKAKKLLANANPEEATQFPYVLRSAEVFLSLKQPQEVVKKLDVITQANEDYRLLGLLSSAYFYLGNTEKASTLFEKALKTKEQKPSHATQSAMNNMLRHNIFYIDQLIAKAYDESQPQLMISGPVKIAYFFKQNNLVNARHEAQMWVKTYPRQAFSYDLLGSVNKAEGDYPSAENAFKSAIKINETYLPARIHLIDILIKQRKYTEARKLLLDTSKHFKPDSRIFLLWSKLEEFEGNRDAAKKWLEKAANLTQSLESGLEFVSFYLRQDRPQLALLLAENLIKFHGDDIRLLTLLGGLYLENTRDCHRAVDVHQKLALFLPDSPGVAQNLSKSYQLCGRPELAIQRLEQYVYKHPNEIETKKHLARLYLHHKSHDKAKLAFEQILKEHPKDYSSLNNLANLYIELDAKKSLGFAKEAYELASTNAAVCDTLGWSYYKNGQINQALTYLVKAHQLDQNLADATYHLAILYREQGQKQVAVAFLKQAVASADPEFSARVQANMLLNHWST